MMKRAILYSLLAFLIPFGGFVYVLKGFPTQDIFFHDHLIHGVIMVLMSLATLFVAYRAYIAYSYSKKVFELFLTLIFYMSSVIFLYHGIFTPGVLFFNDMLFDVLEHTGLLFGSILSLGLGLSLDKWKEGIYKRRSKIVVFIMASSIAYPIFILGTPPIAEYIYSKLDILTGLTAIIFLLSTIMLLAKHNEAMNSLRLYLIVGLSMLINTGIIPFFYKEWNILWWYFHLLTMASFLIIFIGFLRSDKYNLDKTIK